MLDPREPKPAFTVAQSPQGPILLAFVHVAGIELAVIDAIADAVVKKLKDADQPLQPVP